MSFGEAALGAKTDPSFVTSTRMSKCLLRVIY